ncbi:hypothetical protein M011DRAFT_215840 [Sporormia fimetaria CBS 119925]|uniref:Aminoglycoside phosphotransferase domain-containing protein n=1 Tax=Sporormia fimetaria CBS 119925 TaxID=1340428 RepID=A0A6A6V1G8_9PLEO|nr:hypothetical protein M011DRAFT_215840 [Sporormia fimetaria CBS 119925]
MHLPPLDVAVYPLDMMADRRHTGRPADLPSPPASLSPVSPSSAATFGALPNFASLQKAIRRVFRSSTITVRQAERLQGRLYRIFVASLTDGSALVLKCPPAYNTRLLRHEKHGLETEQKILQTLRDYTQIPVPQVIKYDSNGVALGSPFLMMSHIPGRRVSDLMDHLTPSERQSIQRALGAYVRALTSLSAPRFGTVHRVFAGKGHSSWREAFLALLEAALRDGEDMLITIPYDSIRYYIRRHAHYLEEVNEPRLVAFHMCEPQNVLLDPLTKKITGLVGFTSVICGDPLMNGGFSDGSDTFFQGVGERPNRSKGVMARQWMYSAYRSAVQIVGHHYRPELGGNETAARRSLTDALNELARI